LQFSLGRLDHLGRTVFGALATTKKKKKKKNKKKKKKNKKKKIKHKRTGKIKIDLA